MAGRETALNDFAKQAIDDLLGRLLGSADRVVVFWRLVRYGIIGVGVTLVYAILTLVLHYVAGTSTAVASFVGHCCVAVLSFFGHRMFTFQDSGNIARSIPRFIGVNLLGNLVAVAVPWLVSDVLRYPAIVSIALVCLLVPTMNYLLLNIFVFHNARSKPQQAL